jgi:hypothetical protein
MSVGWIVLLSAIGLVGVIAGSCWYMAAMMNLLFVRKHVEIDEVLSTGQPPQAWQKSYLKKLERFQNQGASDETIQRLTRTQQKRNLAGLNRLARYVKKTNLVEDESARKNTLLLLDQCKQQCQQEGAMQNGI